MKSSTTYVQLLVSINCQSPTKKKKKTNSPCIYYSEDSSSTSDDEFEQPNEMECKLKIKLNFNYNNDEINVEMNGAIVQVQYSDINYILFIKFLLVSSFFFINATLLYVQDVCSN